MPPTSFRTVVASRPVPQEPGPTRSMPSAQHVPHHVKLATQQASVIRASRVSPSQQIYVRLVQWQTARTAPETTPSASPVMTSSISTPLIIHSASAAHPAVTNALMDQAARLVRMANTRPPRELVPPARLPIVKIVIATQANARHAKINSSIRITYVRRVTLLALSVLGMLTSARNAKRKRSLSTESAPLVEPTVRRALW